MYIIRTATHICNFSILGIEKPTMFTWRLRIRNIPIAYEGTYMCYVYVVLQIKNICREIRESVW